MRALRDSKSLIAILLFALGIFVAGVQWGLPHNETWEADSLAPYHPLIGLSQLFSFGYFNKYPVVHQWLLAILDLPVVFKAVADSFEGGAFQPYALVARLQSPAYVTPLLLIGALVSVAMAVGTVYLMYRLGRELDGRAAGLFAALFTALDAALNRYAHVAKVEVPHVFWAVLSIWLLARAAREQRRSDHVWSALCACLSFGSKDQAYAIFILPFLLYLIAYPAYFGDRALPLRKRVLTANFGAFALAFALGTLWVENVLLNFGGLIKRVRHLTGDAGFRSAAYSTDSAGALALFTDFNRSVSENMGGPLIYLLALAGIALVIADRQRPARERVLRLLPLVAAFSNYLFFIQIIRQSHDRFALFSSVALGFYAGLAAARLLEAARSRGRKLLGAALITAAALHALYFTARVDIDLLYDVRFPAERWLAQHVPAGARIEFYSSRHFMPRLPEGSYAYQIKRRALAVEQRKPEFIVLSSLDYERYMGTTDKAAIDGRLAATARRLRDRTQTEFPEFYRKLFAGELGYREVARFERALPFPRISSVPETIRIYRRHAGS